jgi:RNA polymerase sigma-70 factor (ECF subfamily)
MPPAAAEASQAQEAWVRGGLDPILDRADLGPAITAALDALPEAFKSVVVLVDLEDQPYEAAAEVLGVPVGTVRSRLFRGRKLLQQSLAQHARDAGLITDRASRSPA